MKRAKSERRLFPRLDLELPINVAANGYDFATSTMNVSCVGAYCRISKYVPPFTKVMIKMALPVSSVKGCEKSKVDCKGVIVRSEDESSGNGFNVAIFFNDIKEEQKKKISRYLGRFLPQKDSEPARA